MDKTSTINPSMNASILTMDTSISTMSTSSTTMNALRTKNPEETRQCTACKARVPVTETRKMCAGCRERNRLRYAIQAQKKRALVEAQRGREMGGLIGELKRKMEEVEGRANATQQDKKRPKTSHASGEMKLKADGVVKSKKTDKTGNKNQVEYQTASEMYSKLNILSNNKYLVFDGHYSIIANPELDNNQRVKIVAKDLRKIANIPFEGHSISCSSNKHGFRAIFQCSCLNQGAKPVPTLYGRDPNVLALSLAGSAVPKQTDSAPRCKGVVKVMSQDDSSHPLGIPGQKITVTVEH